MKKTLLTLAFAGFFGAVTYAQSAKDYSEVYADLSLFEDPLASSLKRGVKKNDINKISNPLIKEVALQQLNGQYSSSYKNGTYKALLSPSLLGEQLSIGDGYSKYENITGVYLPVGQHIVLVDGIAADKSVKLVVPNWLRFPPDAEEPTKDPKGWGIEKKEFTLRNGVNIINLEDFGSLAYIDYFSENPAQEAPIQVHFLTGQENGYFDISKHKDADWNKFADNAVFPIMDAIGKHIQVAYPVEAIKKYAYGRGVELISNYDSLVYRQHRIMGLEKYDKVPENRVLSRVNYNYYMFRDGDGVAYMGGKKGYAMHLVVDPSRVIQGDPCWGFSHEVGHVHQTRPMFNWGGLGEVSNNLFSLYVTRSFGNPTRVSEQKNYQKAKETIIDAGISYLQDEDVFNRLIPFWQLQLYFEGQGNNPDFYPDLFEAFRLQGIANRPSGRRGQGNWASDRMRGERNPAVHQLNFIKTACEVAKVDLTDFFDKYGFFYVGEIEIADYGNYIYAMTQEMVDECKNAIKAMNFTKPVVDISTLTD